MLMDTPPRVSSQINILSLKVLPLHRPGGVPLLKIVGLCQVLHQNISAKKSFECRGDTWVTNKLLLNYLPCAPFQMHPLSSKTYDWNGRKLQRPLCSTRALSLPWTEITLAIGGENLFSCELRRRNSNTSIPIKDSALYMNVKQYIIKNWQKNFPRLEQD